MRGSTREQPNSRSSFVRHTLWLVSLFALAACGGGGGGDGQQQQNPPPQPSNQAPTVTVGADQTIQLPTNSVSVAAASATDPNSDPLTFSWASDPAAGVVFSAPTQSSTDVTFPGEGAYTLTLTVNDGRGGTANDSLVVTVQAAPSGGNTAPVVNAGADQTIQLPTNSVQLFATASDAESDPLTHQWTSAPGGVTFADSAALSTTATFPGEGTYTLTLTANDGAASTSDSLTVTVQPATTPTLFWPAPDDDSSADHGWTRVTPADAGMDATQLAAAEAYASAAGGAGMIVKGGRLVHSWGVGTDTGGNPVNIDTLFPSQSATKSIGGMTLGLALDRGLITLDQTALSILPTFGQPPATNDPTLLDDVTIAQLATHTAGFEKERGYGDLLYTPGQYWSYSDGALNWLADVLTAAFNEDLRTVLHNEVWTRLGVNPNPNPAWGDDVTWRSNESHDQQLPSGVITRELSSGIRINVNAMARVGLMFLRDGMWSDGPVLSQDFVNVASTPWPANAALQVAPDPTQQAEFPSATPANYGVLWWTNAGGQLANVPTDAYWAWGQYDSLLVVIPSLDLVITRIGPNNPSVPNQRVFGEGDWNGDYQVLAPFLEPIVCAAGYTQACAP